jgi:signal transduction histidine kinase
MYGAVVLLTGAALLTVVYLLQKRTADAAVMTAISGSARQRLIVQGGASGVIGTPDPPRVSKVITAVSFVRDDTLHQLLVVSAVSIGVLAVVAVLAGWWLAGRMLRPLQRITATARRLSRDNLSERVELGGPDDELRRLAYTFNDMLARLETAFDSQARFVFNVSHELRTPLALQRAAIEIGLAAPSKRDIGRVREDLLTTNRRIERLIDGLLLLAQGDRGLEHREPVPLHALAEDVADHYAATAAEAGVRVERHTAPTMVRGDPVLLSHLVRNLVQNAITYNVAGGTLEIVVSPEMGLLVRNTGPEIPADRVDELFEPFRRLGPPRTRSERSNGLGLSIVRAIAAAHGGHVVATPNRGGGLVVWVHLCGEAPAPVATAASPAVVEP